MNERIRELAEHCDFYVGNEQYDKSHEDRQQLWVEKFAELIVQECAQIVEENSLPDAYSEPCLATIAEEIKEHFGVEK